MPTRISGREGTGVRVYLSSVAGGCHTDSNSIHLTGSKKSFSDKVIYIIQKHIVLVFGK